MESHGIWKAQKSTNPVSMVMQGYVLFCMAM